MRPLIFLDIDGVLIFSESPNYLTGAKVAAEPHTRFDPGAVSRLNTLLRESDAEVVISSTWRLYHGLEGCRAILAAAGLQYPDRLISVTPNFSLQEKGHHVPRREEIEAWLVTHNDPANPRPFIILDDETDAGIEGHYVKCSWVFGFTSKCLEEAISLLKELSSGTDQ